MDGRYDSERLRWGGDDDRYLGYRHERLRGFGNRLMDRQTDRQTAFATENSCKIQIQKV